VTTKALRLLASVVVPGALGAPAADGAEDPSAAIRGAMLRVMLNLIFLVAALVIGAVTAAHAEEALDQLLAQAQRGDATAQSELGWKYAKGEGVTQDYAEAEKWLRKAADQGNGVAQNNLGVMYGQGQGVTQDYMLAYVWFQRAASTLSGADRETAVKERDLAGSKLTPEQLLRAQQMAQDWKPTTPGGK
jgi:TPR repeat protein